MEEHLLSETTREAWCPTCRAPTLIVREWVIALEGELLVVERGRSAVCEICDVSVLV